jgi:hypothetical protein
MNASHEQMTAVLKETVVPLLRAQKFTGTFPHFRRLREKQIDLLTFQFNRDGGSFVVEIAACDPSGFTTHWGEKIPPKKVSAHDLHPNKRIRLGTRTPGKVDHWFVYEPFRLGICQEIAESLRSLIQSEAETFWQTPQTWSGP